MDVLIMAGGKGSRINNNKKMLLKINDEYIISILIKKLKKLNFNVTVCISDNTIFLNKILNEKIIYGTGDYNCDLKLSLDKLNLPVIVLPADVIFDIEIIEEFIDRSMEIKSGIVNLKINNELTGISIFFEKLYNYELKYSNINYNRNDFFNINYSSDYIMARNFFEK